MTSFPYQAGIGMWSVLDQVIPVWCWFTAGYIDKDSKMPFQAILIFLPPPPLEQQVSKAAGRRQRSQETMSSIACIDIRLKKR
ncbi:unnamed protein product [Sphagnum troendelagicum]